MFTAGLVTSGCICLCLTFANGRTVEITGPFGGPFGDNTQVLVTMYVGTGPRSEAVHVDSDQLAALLAEEALR